MDLDPYQASLQVHIFVGASDCAYAAATYVCCEYPDGMVKVTLAQAKAHPAPIQKQTIPKMELKAAVQGVKLSYEISQAMSIRTSQNIFWSDSMNVLYWIYSQTRSSVQNRCCYSCCNDPHVHNQQEVAAYARSRKSR